jgi:hypothetical protein
MSLCDSLTIANAVSHRRRTRSVRNPCSFRWNRTPWAPSSSPRLPRRYFRWLGLCKGQSPLPAFAFNLTVLSPRGPHCSSLVQACGPAKAFRREQSRHVLGMHATPDQYGLVSASRSPSFLHRDPVDQADVIRYG